MAGAPYSSVWVRAPTWRVVPAWYVCRRRHGPAGPAGKGRSSSSAGGYVTETAPSHTSYHSLQVRSSQDASPRIYLNAGMAPAMASALEIGAPLGAGGAAARAPAVVQWGSEGTCACAERSDDHGCVLHRPATGVHCSLKLHRAQGAPRLLLLAPPCWAAAARLSRDRTPRCVGVAHT